MDSILPITDVAAEKLAILARDSLSSYCYTECKAYCCRHGHLLLTGKEVELFKDTRKEDLKIVSLHDGIDGQRYVLNLKSHVDGCPNLSGYKCIIHKDPDRPKACKEFPLFIWKDKTVMVTNVCPAVKDNMLFPYLTQFKSMGYKIVYGDRNK